MSKRRAIELLHEAATFANDGYGLCSICVVSTHVDAPHILAHEAVEWLVAETGRTNHAAFRMPFALLFAAEAIRTGDVP